MQYDRFFGFLSGSSFYSVEELIDKPGTTLENLLNDDNIIECIKSGNTKVLSL